MAFNTRFQNRKKVFARTLSERGILNWIHSVMRTGVAVLKEDEDLFDAVKAAS